MIEILLNEERRSVPVGTTVAGLIESLGLRPEICAVERNDRIVRRAEHGSTVLAAGDRLEIVTLVGGG